MATRLLTVNFTTCTRAPVNGYRVRYREIGTFGPFINAGNFPLSPAVITVDGVDADTQFEGFIESDCGFGTFGNPQPFNTVGSGGGSGSTGSTGSTASPGGGSEGSPEAGDGEIRVLADCGSAEQKITAVYFTQPVPGFNPPVLAGDLGDYPVLPGETRASTITNYGTGDLNIQFDEDIFPLSVRVRDSTGTIYCANSTSGPGTGNSIVFTGIVMSATPSTTWYVELSCVPCP